MALRIAYVLIAVTAIFLTYGIYDAYTSKSNAGKVESKYAYEPEGADLTVVKFFDYACIYCRQIHPIIKEAVEQDGKVRFIPRGLPSSEKDSVNNFIFAHQAAEVGKFMEIHDQIMRNYGPLELERAAEMGNAAGFDIETLSSNISKQEIQARLSENHELFKKLGGTSTPLFLIGDDMVYVPENQMPAVNDFRNMFDQARAAQ